MERNLLGSMIRITREISFQDLQDGKISRFEVYAEQVRAWIFRPAKELAGLRDDTDKGMAVLALLLMFFEPHGQYLSGKDSQSQSGVTFVKAFDRFVRFLPEGKMMDSEGIKELSDVFWKFARCGLFHSLTLSDKLMIDALGMQKVSLSKNPCLKNSWLVNPWLLLDDMESYLTSYMQDLNDGKDQKLVNNFRATFERLLVEPVNRYLAS